MSEIDFQNGFVVGMALGGKNGAVGGVVPNPENAYNMILNVNLVPAIAGKIDLGALLIVEPIYENIEDFNL